jgi:signal transduction histidine kinase
MSTSTRRATRAAVSARLENDVLVIEVADDGVGGAGSNGGGTGLRGSATGSRRSAAG